ncbi:hypothetical protein CDCA_CDCA15G3969 [Cyanidium caldarium]|uniref:Nascent polypeptide-associated complex subunit beta n=1 Tax=Cyanidium caldarium TaxID=2771 RepID=A0AAV9J0B3_CYACA|nr:hypothetical protein CDCA_CDCA15G3969 [Cyanidium caldarium]
MDPAATPAEPAPQLDTERLQRLRRMSEAVRVGGKGSMRRKKKISAPHTDTTDEKKLHQTLRKLNVAPLTACEEVLLFKEDGTVLRFGKPKLQANFNSRVCALSGVAPRESNMDEVLNDRDLVEKLHKLLLPLMLETGYPLPTGEEGGGDAAARDAGLGTGSGDADTGGDGDEDVPNLEGDVDFESYAQEHAS